MEHVGSGADTPEFVQQLEQFLAGDGSPQELERVERGLAAHPGGKAAIETLRSALEGRKEDGGAHGYAKLWERVSRANRVAVAEGVGETASPVWNIGIPRESLGGRILPRGKGLFGDRLLASLALWVSVKPGGVRASQSRTLNSNNRLSYVAVIVAAAVALVWGTVRTIAFPKRPIDVVTTAGQQATLTLKDGTSVRLAPASRLRVASGFDRRRDVDLIGEAWFDVAAAHGIPFVVHTGRVTTTVLGTVFTVRARDAGRVDVHVDNGRVRTTNARSSVVVDAGATVRVTDSTAVLVASPDPRQYTDWERGQLVFNGISVSDVLATVGQWYGYRFTLTDSTLANQPISVRFKIADPAEMMMLLKDVLDVDLRFDSKTVTLVRRTGHRASPKMHSRYQQFTPSVEMGK